MIVDIFSSFDPATRLLFDIRPILFWRINLVVGVFIRGIFWVSPSRLHFVIIRPLRVIVDQARRTNIKKIRGITLLVASLFLLIIILNLIGVVPYIFSSRSHLLFTLTLGVPLWLRFILSSIIYSPSFTAAALLPGGAPAWLNPFLILIETVSIIARPVTLSVRLAANIRVGHIVLELLGIYLSFRLFNLSALTFIFLLTVQVGYFIFEMGICLIQAYIFCLLLTLYRDEHAR